LDKRSDPDPFPGQDPQPAAPDYSQPTLYDAKKALDAGDVRKARLMLEKLAQSNPNAETFLLLAQLELDNPKKQSKALEHLRQAVALEPQHTTAWLTLANYWSLRSQPDKQRRCLEKILHYEPNNRDVKDALQYLGPKK
jgi:tetratricopeptide (TPR) repeat protein